MAYDPTQWRDGQAPPINAENLNKVEKGISDAHDAIGVLEEKVDAIKGDVDNKYVTKEEGLGYLKSDYLFVTRYKVIDNESSTSIDADCQFTTDQDYWVPGHREDLRDYIVDISSEMMTQTPLGVVGTRIANATQLGKNASYVKVSWAWVDVANKKIKMRLRTDSTAQSVIKAEVFVLWKRKGA